MSERTDRLVEDRMMKVLIDAERYLEERKVSPQLVGTHNVRVPVIGPVTVDFTLSDQSPQSALVGYHGRTTSVEYTSPLFKPDVFVRPIYRLKVGGVWYRPSDRLAAIKNGQIPYELRWWPRVVGVNDRHKRLFQVFVTGPKDAAVQMDLWIVAGAA